MIKDVTHDPEEWRKFWYSTDDDVIDEHSGGISNTQNNSDLQRGSSSIMCTTPTRQDTHVGHDLPGGEQ